MTLIHRLSENPLIDLKAWLDEATQLGLPEPNAITLATATRDAAPSARLVLCKAIEQDGIHFFTNYESRKSRELITNPKATAVFFWPTLARQVRVEGRVEKLSRKISEDYFRSRPRGSQIGAWVSHQSSEIPDYATLEATFAEKEKAFADQDVPCPPHWGGFMIIPSSVEFWLGLPSRLHDRVLVSKISSGDKTVWQKKQLAP
jgi:pyridoxamine 5'-phosphate oxidase